ncbi:MAG: hypothetical protein ACMUEM_04555 [Flavobacteriales bacterium AspAUS03]
MIFFDFMTIGQLKNLTIKRAIRSMNEGNPKAWFDTFSPDTTLSDDGTSRHFTQWL